LPNTCLVDFARIYSQFKVVRMVLCYVPSVASTATGQVAMYYRSNRADVPLSPSSGNFLPWLLSAKNGIIGPVWQPMQHEVVTGKEWLDTEPFMNIDPNREVDGEVFLASNFGVNAVASPSAGIVKIQYIVDFRGFARNPKASLLPVPDQVYIQVGGGINTETIVAGNPAFVRLIYNNIAGQTITATPNGASGDIYKMIFDSTTYSSGTAISLNNLFWVNYGNTGSFNALVFTTPVIVMYGIQVSPGVFDLFDTFDGAVSGGSAITWGSAGVGQSFVFNSIMMSLVGSKTAKSQTNI